MLNQGNLISMTDVFSGLDRPFHSICDSIKVHRNMHKFAGTLTFKGRIFYLYLTIFQSSYFVLKIMMSTLIAIR